MRSVIRNMCKITLFLSSLLFVVCFQSLAIGHETAVHVLKKMHAAVQDTVRGTITDKTTGKPLPGANVFVKGTSNGTATNPDGRYKLAVPSLSDTLEFSYIGYQQTEVAINNRTTINVSLASEAVQGNQLVVVGYGVQKEQDVTGSVGTVKMEAVANQPIVGANEALAGQIAGVKVSTTNGVPGGGPQVNIRGVGAIGAGQTPLYVVDGYPLPESSFDQVSNPLNNIPATDIASINVLKGPSATAIYGSRASNGVVIITTKQGSTGKLQFNFNAYTGWASVPNQEKTPLMNAQQFATFQKQRFEDNGAAVPAIFQNPSKYGKGTDWFAAITRVAPVQNINFSASGGTDKVTAYFSGSVLRQEGVIIQSNYHRIAFRANVAANISPKLKVGLNFAPNYSFGDNKSSGAVGRGYFAGGFSSDLGAQPGYSGEWYSLSPMYPVRQSDGSYTPMIGSISNGVFPLPNPVLALNEITYHKTSTDVIGTAYAQLDLLKELSFKSTLDMETNSTNQKSFIPSTVGAPFSPPPRIPTGSYGTHKFVNWNNDNTVTFNHSFSDGQTINLMADFSAQQQQDDNGLYNGSQFPDNSIKTLNAAAVVTADPTYTYAQSWTLLSYLGRLNYSYKDRYLLTAGVRRDGSSRFGPATRWGTFPSAAIAWRVTNEPWMSKYSSWLSNLKIRASWGITGNNQIGNYSYASQLLPNNYVFNNNLAQGKTVESMSNVNLAWEKTNEINLGLNAGFMHNRITVTADVYRQNTKDLLLNLQVPEASGFTNSIKNIGEVQNKGFELEVSTQNVVKEGFSWSSHFTFSMNRNKVLALGPDGAPIFGGRSGESHPTNITQIGQPVGMFYGYLFDGLYTTSDVNAINQGASNAPAYLSGVPPIAGDMKAADINGDGVITPVTDFTTLGSPYPKFEYGITNTLNYKGLSLNFVFTGSYGAKRMKANYETFHNIDGIFNLPLEYVNNRYRSPSQPGDGRHPTTAGPSQYRVMYRDVSSLNVFDASYLWLKNVTLGYTLPSSITKGYFRSVLLYTSIQNAFIITPYPNGNPAVTDYTSSQSYGGSLSPGIDFTPYPTPRVITVGIKINY